MVAIEAREKKRQMFSKKDPMEAATNSKGMFKSKNNMFSITKYSQSKQGAVTEKVRGAPQFDLSLQALSKELESRQMSNPASEKAEKRLLGELKDNCDQEIKFISLRREFECPPMVGSEVNEMLPKMKWAIKEHTNYELEFIKNHIEEKKKKLNKIIY